MHVISRRMLLEAGSRHADLVAPLDAWYRITKKASWSSLPEMRQQLPTADLVGQFVVFNIKGNAYRLIAEVYFASQVVLVRHVLTHAEYDNGGWK